MNYAHWRNRVRFILGFGMVGVVLSFSANQVAAEWGDASSRVKVMGSEPAASDYFGVSVARLGDLNGDGIEDMAAGAFYDDDGAGDAGAVYVLFMNTNGTVKSNQKISELSGNGPNLDAGDNFGSGVAGLGDLDGDGIEDVAVGAYYDDDGAADAGAVYVLFLNTNGTVKTSQKISELSGNGPNLDASDYFGISVAGLGDLDGDGIEDMAAGAVYDDDGTNDAGAVYVLFLNTNGTVKTSQKISELSGGGPDLDANDYFGVNVADLGDLDGDGIKDVAAGAHWDDDGAADAGAVYVLFMNTNGTVKSNQKISELSGGGPNLDAGDYFGVGVAGLGDLDGDGIEDMAAGAYCDDDGAGQAGAVYVLFLNTNGTVKTSRKISELSGGGPNLDAGDYFGRSVAGLGDLNGDGVEDMAGGAYGDDDGAADAGAVYVLFMNTNGTVNTSRKIAALSGNGPSPDASDYFGVSVAGLGDLDGDGIKDVAAGAHFDDDGAGDAGAVYVLFMKTDGIVKSYQKISELSGNGPNLDASDYFGISVAGLGDLDGDGIEDMAAAAYGDDDSAGQAGAVYVLFLNTNGTVKSNQKISELSGGGPNLDAGDYFGVGVAGLGDLDGDGIEDVAVGAYADDDGTNDAGAVYVLFLNTNGTVKSYQKISELSGGGPDLDTTDYFGRSVAGLGDLDKDGVEDMAAGAYCDDDGAANAGAVYVLFLNTNGTVKSNQKISELSGGGPNLDASDYFGMSVAKVNDLDGDDIDDIACGAYLDDDGAADAGAVYVLFMNANGTAKSFRKISELSGNGPNLDAGDGFGLSVAGIGDLDGDGVEDIAAGAYGDDDGQVDAGAVYLLMLDGARASGTMFKVR